MFLNLSSTGGFLFACCVVYGLTFLIKDSTLLAQPRELIRKISFFDRMLDCSFCTGAWVGLGIGTWELVSSADVLGQLVEAPMWQQCTEVLVGYMAACATISYVFDLFTQLLERKLHVEE